MSLLEYFTVGIEKPTGRIGMEVETSFVNSRGEPATVEDSQAIFRELVVKGWRVTQKKGSLITVLKDHDGNRILYELGRQNLEVASLADVPRTVIPSVLNVLEQMYLAAYTCGLEPVFEPVLETEEDLLVIPNERDAAWLELDGRPALNLLAKTSSVQFTLEVSVSRAVAVLNALGKAAGSFIKAYPQDALWKRYIQESNAGYREDRYGGPLIFESLEDYVEKLREHDVVHEMKLVPHAEVTLLDMPLFVRSVWWHFRLRRYANRLCIEARPLARGADSAFKRQLDHVLGAIT